MTLLNSANPAARPVLSLAARLCLALSAALLAGCADTTYKQLRLGQQRSEYDRIMPRESTRATDYGMAYLTHSAAKGRTDAIVVLVTPDRRIAGKIQAVVVERANWLLPGSTQRGFLLRGEIDPHIAQLEATGPVDTLRLVAADLIRYRGDRLATDSHAIVAGGLVRLMQAWPNVTDVGVDTARIAPVLEQIPAGGVTNIAVNSDGVYRFDYRQGAAP